MSFFLFLSFSMCVYSLSFSFTVFPSFSLCLCHYDFCVYGVFISLSVMLYVSVFCVYFFLCLPFYPSFFLFPSFNVMSYVVYFHQLVKIFFLIFACKKAENTAKLMMFSLFFKGARPAFLCQRVIGNEQKNYYF